MRRFVWLFLLIVLVLGGLWAGAEIWAAARLRAMIAAQPDLHAVSVRPLRDPTRVGLHVRHVRLDNPAPPARAFAGLDLDGVDLWLSPLSPLRLDMRLADNAMLDLPGGPVPLHLSDTGVWLGLSALNGAEIGAAGLISGPVGIGGQPVLGTVRLAADLVPMDAHAPEGAQRAYDLGLSLSGFQLDGLQRFGIAPLALPGALSAEGRARVWLDGPIGAFSHDAVPDLAGVQSDGLHLRLGDLSARLTGRLVRGRDGLTEGRVALYTPDGQAFLRAAADAGLIPQNGMMLAQVMLDQLAQMPMPDAPTPDGLSFPPPGSGELRIPVILRDGQLYLGRMPIGPAPAFPGRLSGRF